MQKHGFLREMVIAGGGEQYGNDGKRHKNSHLRLIASGYSRWRRRESNPRPVDS